MENNINKKLERCTVGKSLEKNFKDASNKRKEAIEKAFKHGTKTPLSFSTYKNSDIFWLTELIEHSNACKQCKETKNEIGL